MFSCVFTLALMEIAARLLSLYVPGFPCYFFSSDEDIFSCRLGVYLPMARARYNQSTGRSDEDLCDRWDPLLGWAPGPNCRTRLYSTNSRGFRGAEEHPARTDKRRFVFVGDSFTWGEEVKDNETYPSFLESLYAGQAEVVNLGVHGYGPCQFSLRYQRDGAAFTPDELIFGLFIEDIHREDLIVRDFYKPRCTFDDGRLVSTGVSAIPTIDEAIELGKKKRHESRFYVLSRLKYEFERLAADRRGYARDVATTLDVVSDLRRRLEARTRMTVLLIPSVEMVDGTNKDYFGAYPLIKAGLDGLRVGYVDLLEPLVRYHAATGKSAYDGHFTADANALVAREIKSRLQ